MQYGYYVVLQWETYFFPQCFTYRADSSSNSGRGLFGPFARSTCDRCNICTSICLFYNMCIYLNRGQALGQWDITLVFRKDNFHIRFLQNVFIYMRSYGFYLCCVFSFLLTNSSVGIHTNILEKYRIFRSYAAIKNVQFLLSVQTYFQN